jgi:hypothetical protein
MKSPEPEWVIRAIDRDHCVAVWDRVLVQVWHLATTPAAVRQLNVIARALLAETCSPISSIAIVEPTSPPPDDAVRTLLSKFYRDLAPRMNEQLVVAAGGGFRGAIVRAVGLTLSTLAPRTLPFRFVGTLAEATALIAPHLSPAAAGGEASLRRVLDGVRRESLAVTATDEKRKWVGDGRNGPFRA